MRLEILLALESLGIDEEWHGTTVRTDKMTAEEHAQFTGDLVELDRQSLPGPLRRKPLEWLEILAEEKALEAQKLILQADLAGGEKLLLEAFAHPLLSLLSKATRGCSA